MRNIVEYGRERVGGAVVEKRLWKRKQRQQGGRRKAIGTKGRATYTYKVCEAGTQTCSNQATVRFGGGPN